MEMMNRNAKDLDLFSALDLINELARRGYNLSGAHEKSEMKTRMTKAMNEVNWSNWEQEDGTHFKLGDVYYSQLDWIKESQLIDEDDEAYDTILALQETICPILNLLDNE